MSISPKLAWHARSVDETTRELKSDLALGLDDGDAAERLVRYGPNALAPARRRSALAMFARQFRSLIVGLLIAAGGVALALGDTIEAVAILVVIILNAVIGFTTEWKAASALEGLRSQAVSVARVLRGGRERQEPAEGLVPGDVVLLDAGDRVPADGRLVEQARLQVDESALTGESAPVMKCVDPVTDTRAPVGDRSSMLHMGTAVTDGRGRAVVTATGAQTEMGRIGALIDGVGVQETPLEAKLAQLSRALLVIVLVLCAVIILVGWLRGNGLLAMVEIGISLAIAAVPEGLLAVTTMTLAVGMQRMARMNALVRRLPAVEALGSTTVICSDKTGTLTRNEMTVCAFVVAGRRVDVTGTGYTAKGECQIDGRRVDLMNDASWEEALHLALRIGALCNDAKIDRSGAAAAVLGDPTEAALLVAAEKAGLDGAALARDYPRVQEIPFSSETKMMATVHATPGGGRVVA
jgi:magnesium-transporting ATPase (P-type)